jgi:hypothetical protein
MTEPENDSSPKLQVQSVKWDGLWADAEKLVWYDGVNTKLWDDGPVER